MLMKSRNFPFDFMATTIGEAHKMGIAVEVSTGSKNSYLNNFSSSVEFCYWNTIGTFRLDIFLGVVDFMTF